MVRAKIKAFFASTRFSFGSSSSVITCLALIIGLNTLGNLREVLAGSLVVLGVADNISDSFGIHMYQESEGLTHRQVWFLTISNFISRLFITGGFLIIVLTVPSSAMALVAILYGLAVLSAVSYSIARERKINPLYSIAEHLFLAALVMGMSKFAGAAITRYFH